MHYRGWKYLWNSVCVCRGLVKVNLDPGFRLGHIPPQPPLSTCLTTRWTDVHTYDFSIFFSIDQQNKRNLMVNLSDFIETHVLAVVQTACVVRVAWPRADQAALDTAAPGETR